MIALAGCDSNTSSVPSDDVTVEKVWHGETDHIAIPEEIPEFDLSAIPTIDSIDRAERKFEISIDVNGQLFRHGEVTTQSAVIEELHATKNISDVAVIVTGDSDVRISTVTALQRALWDAIPELGSVTYIAVRKTEDG